MYIARQIAFNKFEAVCISNIAQRGMFKLKIKHSNIKQHLQSKSPLQPHSKFLELLIKHKCHLVPIIKTIQNRWWQKHYLIDPF